MELIGISALIAIALLVVELADYLRGYTLDRSGEQSPPQPLLETLSREPAVTSVAAAAQTTDLDRAA